MKPSERIKMMAQAMEGMSIPEFNRLQGLVVEEFEKSRSAVKLDTKENLEGVFAKMYVTTEEEQNDDPTF